jgi:prophage maintenance system killer protein
LLHDQHPGVCEEQLCYTDAHEAAALHFMAMTMSHLFAVEVATKIFYEMSPM